jgi:dynein heavy chain
MRSKMVTTHNFIVDAMRGMFDVVKEGGSEVKREWRALVAKVDKDIESALRQAVKRSLQELSRAINGDAKTEPQTVSLSCVTPLFCAPTPHAVTAFFHLTQLFNINIVLEAGRMDYRPTMINLTHAVNIVAKELISTINVVPRLREVLAQTGSDHPKGKSLKLEGSTEVADPASSDQAPVAAIPAPSTQPTFYNLISNDEETLKIVVHVMNGMSASATELQKYLSYWDKYKYIWEVGPR